MVTYLIRTVEDSECAFEIIGYTNDLTEAKKICAEHNKGAESWQKWIVEELKAITDIPQVEVVSLWKFKYFLDKKTKSLESGQSLQLFEIEKNQEHELIFENSREGVYCFLCDIYGKENEKEAEKIAEEMIAEYRQQKGDIMNGEKLPKATWESYNSHDCEAFYRCPICNKVFGSWSYSEQKQECPWCKGKIRIK